MIAPPAETYAVTADVPLAPALLAVRSGRGDIIVPECPICGLEHIYANREDEDILDPYPSRCPVRGYGFMARLDRDTNR